MKSLNLPIVIVFIFTLAMTACAGSPAPVSNDFPVTETAIASTVMTQVAMQNPTPLPAQPTSMAPQAGGQTPMPGGAPGPSLFSNLTPEQENCLKLAWGDEAFTAITTNQRKPTPEEALAIGACNLPKPANGGGGLGQQPGGTFQPGGNNQPGGNQPRGGAGPGGQPLSFSDQTYVSTSADGLTWSAGVLLAEKASVPEVIYTSKGEYWAYWVDFTNATGPGTEKIGIAYSRDGVTWEKKGNAQFTGVDGIVPVDPDLMELPDGTLRMYFFDISGNQIMNTIYSAVSSDGINFTFENGSRFSEQGIYDPNVIKLPDGTYRMYLNKQDIISASSPDGLTFTADPGIRVEKGAVPGAIVLPDGSARLYACAQGISVYKSSDGLNFSLEKQNLITGQQGVLCDPSVSATANGYVMVYKFNSGAKPKP